MKIVVFNCKFSENLGDGLLAESLENAIRAIRPGIEIRAADLAGRETYGQISTPRRHQAIRLLGSCPAAVRRLAVRALLARKLHNLDGRWRHLLEGADLAVFGGGQIFQDGDLNFPLKVGKALALCEQMHVPVAVHSVGVSQQWSAPGRALFRRLLNTRCVMVSVRDAGSRMAWARHFANTALEKVAVVPDPALLWPAPEPGAVGAIGLNITDPGLLRYHGGAALTADASAALFSQTVRTLEANSEPVVLFTNGAAEDEAHLDKVMARLGATSAIRAPRPRTPADLVATQTGLAAVVAHRLHACILAYRLGTPSVGLGWDRKLESFFEETGRTAFFIPGRAISAAAITERLAEARAAPSVGVARDRMMVAAQAGIAALLASLEGSARCSIAEA